MNQVQEDPMKLTPSTQMTMSETVSANEEPVEVNMTQHGAPYHLMKVENKQVPVSITIAKSTNILREYITHYCTVLQPLRKFSTLVKLRTTLYINGLIPTIVNQLQLLYYYIQSL